MMKTLICLAAIASALAASSSAFSQGSKLDSEAGNRLRLFNIEVFGRRTTEPIVLLEPSQAGQVDPETVMVDIENGQYYAATLRYPNEVSFEAARESLNRVYRKWENETFADDPGMGIWRNEDDQFSIQLSKDGFNIVVVYIKFSMVTTDQLMQGWSRATRLADDEEKARTAIATMRDLLDKGESETFYRLHCHKHLRKQIGTDEFIDLIRSDQGKKIVALFDAVHDATKQDEGEDILISRFNERNSDEYEFVLVEARRHADNGQRWHIELKKEDSLWKLKDFD